MQMNDQKPSALDGQTLSMGRLRLGTCSRSTLWTRVCSKQYKGDRRCEWHHWRRWEPPIPWRQQQRKRLVVVPLWCGLATSWQQVSSHLNAKNKTRYALSTGEFLTLFLSANLTSHQAWGPGTAICHTGSASCIFSSAEAGKLEGNPRDITSMGTVDLRWKSA